ncbi:MAG: Hpt domain-containing protein, partial [Candidatus Sericytochromatia bacterium]|nr:Hpt domain-containing protein [Candidatus Tanganyikabacteria bacterium]
MAFDRAAFLARYCDEADDHLRSIDDTLVALEATPGKAELLALTMRAMHTLKGASRMLKVSDVATVAHAAEDLLVAARDGRFQLGAEHVTLLSRASDLMREILGELRAGREGGFGEAVAGVAGELQDAAELAPAGDPPRSSRPLLGPERS